MGSAGGSQKWIETSVPQTSAGATLGSSDEDLASQIQLLAQQGATVKKIGSATIDGVGTTEYSVVPSKQELISGIKKELAGSKLPAELKAQLQAAEESPPSLSMDVWIDSSSLLRRESVKVSLSVPGSSTAGSANIVMTLGNYGSEVDITAPPPGDVQSISSLYSSIDSVAQSNLTNAVTEGMALYQVNQAYGSGARAYGASDFSAQAPEFNWTTGACGASPADCISFTILDVSASGDHQGMAVAAYSSTGTCWYDIDIESTPARISGDPAAIWSVAGGGQNSSLAPGVWYATSPKGASQTSCSASTVLHPSGHVAWGNTYSSAGSLG